MLLKPCAVVTCVVSFATSVGGCKRAAEPAARPDGGEVVAPLYGMEAGPFVAVRIPDDSGPTAPGIPVPLSKVESALNPERLAPYAGPTGVVEGVITVSGDPPPKRELDIPFACGEAYATYGK